MTNRDAVSSVDVRWERVEIPTYPAGPPCPHPMFLDKRVYQGSSGAVYPFPVIESVGAACRPQAYEAALLENEYLQLMILPELGGRLQMAIDKTNGYRFVYWNRVIKPALVGLTGPWISGGIEFNWPQHHRPSTFLPVDCDLERHADGSATVWCHEIDRMVGTRGLHGFRLHPGRAYLEIVVRLANRTSQPETFLWWANPAVHVDENHQSIFPPDVRAVTDHGKRAVSAFPIATGEYYQVDYSAGVDISRYKNIPAPTSYMACASNFDFVGSYDHGRQAGLLHVASHYVAPGKKQWTWGCGEFGRAWDRRLTDEDGPYVELMCGVYADNQPDFSWLAPGEEKAFSQYFLPYKGVGVVKNATRDAALGVEIRGTQAVVRAYATARQLGATVSVRLGERELLRCVVDCDPRASIEVAADVPPGVDEDALVVVLADAGGRELVSYRGVPEEFPIPEPAQPIGEPAELDSAESLYLAAVHLEQYRHATRRPADYLREALRRDPGDVRCQTAMSRLRYRRGEYAAARGHAAAAVARATRHNPNPLDGEPFVLLGLAEAALGDERAAIAAWHKAAWSAASQPQAYFELAKAAMRQGDAAEAQRWLARCLDRNANHSPARHLEVCLLVERGELAAAKRLAERELARDPFGLGIVYAYVTDLGGDPQLLERRLRHDSHSYRELAHDLAEAGLRRQADDVLQRYLDRCGDRRPDPQLVYCLAWLRGQRGLADEVRDLLRLAASLPRHEFFPNSLADLRALEFAVAVQPTDARAWCDLGNLLFSKQRSEEAIASWERAAKLAPEFPQPRRNLGLAYYNTRRDPPAAWEAMEAAWRLDPTDARVLFELDQLAKRLNHPAADRLRRLESHRDSVAARDDLTLEFATLLNQLGEHERALETLLARTFHPWEGGEGKPAAQYVLALVQLARRALAAREFAQADELLQRASVWPASLGDGKLPGLQENHLDFWRGAALRGLERHDEARRCFDRASVGPASMARAQFYYDQPPETTFYQGLANLARGRRAAAVALFESLVRYGDQHFAQRASIDFFAVSLPDFLVFEADPVADHQVHCRFLRALGLIGLNRLAEAEAEFRQILAVDANHQGALVHRSLCQAHERESLVADGPPDVDDAPSPLPAAADGDRPASSRGSDSIRP
ncbi:MAG: DUF5107 domain-containing protein [Pirellulales bacterium]|nr:DUF5107 domain-containing protein [Pirellulales bacterium]